MSKWKDYILIAIMTAVSWGLSQFVIFDISSLPLFSGGSVPDIEISDLYSAVGSRKLVSQKAQNVSIVSIDGCTRQQIADAIELISFMNPSSLGVDVFFRIEDKEGAAIKDALLGIHNLVLPIDIHHPEAVSFFHDSIPGAVSAYVNIISSNPTGFVREFSILKEDMPSFSYALAQCTPPIPPYRIRFDGIDVPVIRANELSLADESDIQGKIVLLGAVNDASDQYRTSLGFRTPGVLIHAIVAEMLSRGIYIHVCPSWIEKVLAIIICFLFLGLLLFAKRAYDDAGTLFMRLLQVLLILFFFLLGVKLYLEMNIYVDLALMISMLAMGSLVFDIVVGMYCLFRRNQKI